MEAIFSMCTEFQLPREVCYLASELFERWFFNLAFVTLCSHDLRFCSYC